MLCAYSVIAFDVALVFVVRFKNGEDVSGSCSVSASYLALCIVGRWGWKDEKKAFHHKEVEFTG